MGSVFVLSHNLDGEYLWCVAQNWQHDSGHGRKSVSIDIGNKSTLCFLMHSINGGCVVACATECIQNVIKINSIESYRFVCSQLHDFAHILKLPLCFGFRFSSSLFTGYFVRFIYIHSSDFIVTFSPNEH